MLRVDARQGMHQAHSTRGLLLLLFLFLSQLSFFAMEEGPLSKILKDEMRRQAGSKHRCPGIECLSFTPS